MKTLYLIPSPLSDSPAVEYQQFFTPVIDCLKLFIVENAKKARANLKQLGIKQKIQDCTLIEYAEIIEQKNIKHYLEQLFNDHSEIGLLSDAGCPAIADPGSEIVYAAHALGINVVPLIGPNSITLALMASGFCGQRFSFHGYLPKEKPERMDRLRYLESLSKKLDQTQIWIETPYKAKHTLNDCIECLQNTTKLCLGIELTGLTQTIISQSISDWKDSALPDLEKKNVVFLMHTNV